jgi:hypothetical protein
MFGLFRNRKKYNGTVDKTLNTAYGIATRDNPHFPKMLSYLESIDEGWNSKFSEDECALMIASSYYCGLVINGIDDEAKYLFSRIKHLVEFGVSKRIFEKNQWEGLHALFEKAHEDASNNIQQTTKTKLAGQIASIIDRVIDNDGISNLIDGFLVLDKNFRVRFVGGITGTFDIDKIAVTEISDLKSSELFKHLVPLGNDTAGLAQLTSPFIDKMVYEVLGEFAIQSEEFENLPNS